MKNMEAGAGMADKSKDKPVGGPDKDSLDVLSLSSIPLSSNTLKNAKLIKNSRLETAVELYNDPVAGSLQIYPEDIADQIAATPRDQEIVNQLASLSSYDVYSLRSSLKKLGIDVTDSAALDLSDDMKEALDGISVHFTRPLIEKIFGSGKLDVTDAHALQKVFRDPDVSRVRENLKIMTEKTGIPLADLPQFLEEYSEVFLSVAYYRYSFDAISPDADRFLVWIKELREHKDVASSPQTAQSCRKVDEAMRFLVMSIRERLAKFELNFETFWKDINRQSFTRLRGQIEENHSSMGAVLCGLGVKLRGWGKEFSENNIGGPQKRAKYVVTDLEPGVEKLKVLETDARKKLGLK
jgi:hypothetical protein